MLAHLFDLGDAFVFHIFVKFPSKTSGVDAKLTKIQESLYSIRGCRKTTISSFVQVGLSVGDY